MKDYANNIRVVNLNGASPCRSEPDEAVFLVNRQGPLGNPHHMKYRSMSERLRVIDAYKADLDSIISGSLAAREQIKKIENTLRQGKKVALACHCAPLPCHADCIRELILEHMMRDKPRFHPDGTLPQRPDTIFVFGSNLRGRHGKGAALIAAERFGAVEGIGSGASENSYAIPTKDEYIRTRSLEDIAGAIMEFCQYAKDHNDRRFFVTRVGCGLAGLEDQVVANIFKTSFEALDYVPVNCSFADTWQEWLDFTHRDSQTDEYVLHV